MKLENGFWIDENDNKWNIMRYSGNEAMYESKQMKNCERCIDCTNCENCVGCINSHYCINSINVMNCRKCVDCENCTDCHECENCTDCKYCLYSIKQKHKEHHHQYKL